MKHQSIHLLKLIVIASLLLLPATAFTQGTGETFNDPDGEYSLKLPPDWTAVVSKDGLGRSEVTIVYRDVRENGALKVRRLEVAAGTDAMAAAKDEEQNTLRFQPGYVKGTMENFAAGPGTKSAVTLSYDYTQGGRPKMGRAYFIQINETTIFSLRFTGNRNTLGVVRAQTDNIARSFKAK